MSNLPKSVQDQVKRANDAQAAILNPVISTEAAQELQKEVATDTPNQPEQAAIDPIQSAKPDEDAIYWRSRFNVLQGKYNAEVPALNTKIKELEVKVSEAVQAQSNNDGDAKARATTALSDMSTADVEEFGPELIAVIERTINRQVSTPTSNNDEVNQLKNKVEQIEQSTQVSAEAQFWTDLQRRVPDFQSINASVDFLRWLDEADAMSGKPREDLLLDAQRVNDASRVAEIFNAFKQAVPTKQIPASKQQPDQTRANETEVNAAQAWTRAGIKEFYSKAARGHYPPTPEGTAERNRIEQSIHAAMQAGLIT